MLCTLLLQNHEVKQYNAACYDPLKWSKHNGTFQTCRTPALSKDSVTDKGIESICMRNKTLMMSCVQCQDQGEGAGQGKPGMAEGRRLPMLAAALHVVVLGLCTLPAALPVTSYVKPSS